MDKSEYKIANSITIVTSFISILINLSIIRMHIKQPLLKNGFFNVVFGQIITELIINFSLFILNILFLIFEDRIDSWILIFPACFNFGYIANIVYNIRIIFFLMTFNSERDELINYEGSENESRRSLSRQESLTFEDISFKNFHYLTFIIATIHTIFYILNFTIFQSDEDKGDNLVWYLYFIYQDKTFWRLFFFLFHIIFFLISLYYLIKSCNKNKISNHIYLRSFALYSFFSSLISLLFPIFFLITAIKFHNSNDDFSKIDHNLYLILLIPFFGFLLLTAIYRVKCYYVNYILAQDGKSCFKKWINMFKILFCCKVMEPLNFIDYNSSFIYHALSTTGDFILDDINEIPSVQLTETQAANN